VQREFEFGKAACKHADEINQFHQHFASSFCADILLPKNHKAKL